MTSAADRSLSNSTLGGGPGHPAATGARGARFHFLATAAALATALALTGFYGYYVMFSTFQPYDDEGFLDISLRDFLAGRAIYDEVFTQYGTFYYVFNGVVFRLASMAVDNDSVRLLAIGMWVACALLAAVFTIRLTGSVTLALAALAITGQHLRAFADEPGHPGGLCALLAMLVAATAAFFAPRRRALVCAMLGALVGCLVATKMNIGVFALLALALTLCGATPGRLAALVRAATSVVILALPAILMRMHLQDFRPRHLPVYHYALLETLSLLPVVLLQWSNRSGLRLAARDGVWAAVACAAAFLASATAVAIHGTSPYAVLLGPLEQAIKFPTVFVAPPPIDSASVGLAAAMLGLFVAVQCLRWWSADSRTLHLGLGGVKIAYAVYVLSVVYLGTPGGPLEIGVGWPGRNALLQNALPFVWLAMVPLTGATVDPTQHFARRLLSTLAVLNSLQAYPVAGSQLSFGTVLIVIVAAVCLHDGITAVAETLPRWMRTAPSRRAAGVVAVAVVLLAQWNLVSVARQRYQSLVPFDLPGARRLRTSEGRVALYRWLAFNLRAHADTFIGMPALNSLYFWSEKEPPTRLNPNAWMLLLNDAQQQQVVDSLARHPNACAVVVERLNRMYRQGRRIEQQPLALYIRNEFQPVGASQGYELRVRKDRTPPELIYCARRLEPAAAAAQPADWSALLSLPPMRDRSVHRMVAVDAVGRTLADTLPASGGSRLEVADERAGDATTPLALDSGGLALASPRRLVLRVSAPSPLLDADGTLLRLYDRQGNVFASIPFVR